MSFGNQDAVLAFLRMVAYKEGFGKIFSDGTKREAQAIGKGAEHYAMEVKGLEMPAYDVRDLKAQGLNFATSYTGAHHNRGYASYTRVRPVWLTGISSFSCPFWLEDEIL